MEWVADGIEAEIILLCDNAAAVLAIRKRLVEDARRYGVTDKNVGSL